MEANQNLIKVFEYALNQEETGKSFFQTSLLRMGIGDAVSAFSRLIKEEEQHILFIKEILDGLKRGSPDQLQIEKGYDLGPTNYFDERARSEFLQQRLYESMVPDITVFSVAWLIEKDLTEFYERMANQTEGKPREAFLMLAHWEKGHERFFREYRDRLTEIYSKMPWAG
jgi:rubrerythrin